MLLNVLADHSLLLYIVVLNP